MNKTSIAAGFAGALCIAAFTAESASAQDAGWPTGAEIAGHSVRVDFADGITNTVYFNRGGTARIVGVDGREVQGRWFVENQMLCLQTAANSRECWPYRTAFVAGQPVALTSDCMVTSRWTALSTEPLAPPPAVERGGERG